MGPGPLRERLARHHDDVDSAFWGWNDVWLDPAFRSWDIREEVARITAPLLAIQGEGDEYGTLEQVHGIGRLLPQAEAYAQGCAQVLFLDSSEGKYLEELGGMNIVLVTNDGRLLTPESDSILRGITRTAILKLAEVEAIELDERPFSVDEAKRAKEVFVTAASSFVMPIVSLDGAKIADGKPGPVATRLREVYLEQARREAI